MENKVTPVTVYGWEKGIKTISLMHLLVRETGVSMQEAKRQVENLLAGGSIDFEVGPENSADAFADELSDIGALWRFS